MKSRRSGFTFVELLVSMSVLAFIIAGSVKLAKTMMKTSFKAMMSKAEDRDVGNIMETVIKQFNNQQITFVSLALDSRDPKLDELPLAWNDRTLVPADQCVTCPGRMAVIARPHPQLPGIFVVKVRMTNKELFNGQKEFKFLAVHK